MSTSRTDHVYDGVWTDHSQKFGRRTQLLVTDFHSNLITNVLGVLVPIACARLFRIVLRGLEIRGVLHYRPKPPETLAWSNARSGLDVIGQGAIHLGPPQPVPPTRRRESVRLFLMSASFLAIFLSFLVFGVLTALLASNRLALSKHPLCGLYITRGSTAAEVSNYSITYESRAQAESGTLSESCLNSGNADCGTFLNPAFSVTVKNTTCPFDEHICYGQGVSPISISTGAVSARKIGVSSPRLLEFNRTTICSPLNMNSTYVHQISLDGNTTNYAYNYGPSVTWATASYETVRHGDRGDVPGYQVAALWSNGDPGNPWRPIRALHPKFRSTTTLVIVVSQKINYLEKSLDPIFPATDTTQFEDDPRTYYINLSGAGRVFACLDTTEWRDPAFGPSWIPLGKLPTKQMHDSPNARAIYFLINSLAGSSIFGAMNLRLAAALVAQNRISGFVSLPLAAEQWKAEVQQLFNASLARVMINARDIARGARSQYYGFTKLPRPAVDICQETYVMQSSGWQNINFTGMVCVLCFSVVVILLAVPFTKEAPNGDEIDELSGEYVCKWLWAFVKLVYKLGAKGLDFLIDLWRNRPRLPPWARIKQALASLFTY